MTINVDEALKELRNKAIQEEKLLFDIGTKVTITRNRNIKGYTNLEGCKGEVIGWRSNIPPNGLPKYYTYRVRIEGKQNQFTIDGAFIFSKHYLEKATNNNEKEVNKMLLKGYNVVGVKFEGNDMTYYFASYEKGLKNGDLVCVDTRYGFKCAIISNADVDIKEVTGVDQEVTKQVVCKINTKAYENRIKQAERIQELEKMLEDKLKDAQKLAVYEMLAKSSAEFAKLLDEYKSLTENK